MLTLPSLGAGLLFDDYHHKLLMQNSDSPLRLLSAPWDMFRIIEGDPRRNAELMDYGILAWWADVNIKGAFWRPIASLTHWLDYLLWPGTPALMHAQSIVWYALLVAAAALFYRRFGGLGVSAGLAALLYAVAGAHATPVGFLANRNALIAALFGVLCLMTHERWRRANWRPGVVIAPLLLALGLLAKEEAIATCAYLAAFTVFLDHATWRRRIASLFPYAAVVIIWRVAWLHLGYGVSSLGLYIDPLREPLRFAFALVGRAPILLLSGISTIPAELNMLFQGAQRVWLSVFAWLILAGIALIGLSAIGARRTTKFWLAGMLLSLLPAATTFPSDRMLLFAGLGAMALISEFLVTAFSSALPGGYIQRTTALGLAWVFVLLHVAVAPIALAIRSAAPMGARSFVESLYINHPLDPTVERQDLVIVNPPSAFAMMAPLFIWASEKAPMPRHFRVLCSSNFHSVEVQRTGERTLVVWPETGFLASDMDRLFSGEGRVFTAGQQVRLTGLDIEITSVTSAGRPTGVAFRFAAPLEDQSFRWMQWHRGEFVAFVPPPVGTSVTLSTTWRDAFGPRHDRR